MGLPTYARNLTKLPVELVHRVLDDLTHLRVLRIIALNNTYLNECILSHSHFRASLRGMFDLSEVNAIFQLYQDILDSQFSIIYPPKYSTLHRGVRYEFDLSKYIREEICAILRSGERLAGGRDRLNVLSDYLTVPFAEFCDLYDSACSKLTAPLPVLQQLWIMIKEAAEKLNRHKSRQLTLAADLLEAYPGKLYLKKPHDPSQGSARQNTAHIVKRFRVDAKKVLKGRLLSGRFISHWAYGMDSLPLVPYDRYLVQVLKARKNRPPSPSSLSTASLSGLYLGQNSTTASSHNGNQRTPGDWPLATLADYQIVMNGLSHVYKRPLYPGHEPEKSLLKRARIDPQFLESDGESINVENPAIFVTAPRARRDMKKFGSPAHDDREYEWLQAFLRVVTWIEGENMEKVHENRTPAVETTELPTHIKTDTLRPAASVFEVDFQD